MNLREYCKKQDETEVWDQQVDIGCPYYNQDGDNCYQNTEEEHYLFLMENWLLSLPVSHTNGYSCCVDVFKEISENWGHLVNCMQENGTYNFDFGSDIMDDDEAMASYAEDVFTCLSQGFYSFAQDFCHFMGLEEAHLAQLADDFDNGKIQKVYVEEFPDSDQIYFYEVPNLRWDASQGSGNLIYEYFYVPALNIICTYASF